MPEMRCYFLNLESARLRSWQAQALKQSRAHCVETQMPPSAPLLRLRGSQLNRPPCYANWHWSDLLLTAVLLLSLCACGMRSVTGHVGHKVIPLVLDQPGLRQGQAALPLLVSSARNRANLLEASQQTDGCPSPIEACSAEAQTLPCDG